MFEPLTMYRMPVLLVDLPPAKVMMYPPSKRDFIKICNFSGLDGDLSELCGQILEKYAVKPIKCPFVQMTAVAFLKSYIDSLKIYKEQNKDLYEVPNRPDFSVQGYVSHELDPVCVGEHLVYEYSGVDFIAQLDMSITEYWLIMADAVKTKILTRADGKGREELAKCYEAMHPRHSWSK